MIDNNKRFNFFSRRDTSLVLIGTVSIGAGFPVVVQSMATVDTALTNEAVEQAIRIFLAGAKIVRFTAQSVSQAANLRMIRESLDDKGVILPLVADIHFNSKAAFEAAKWVEKVRINPGNFIDKRAVFKYVNYSEEQYRQELSRLEDLFVQFLNVCREHNTAIRIGVNHGSLSDRIMSRYGNTIEGMTESAMEFLRICKKYKFDNVIVSMKSSNTVTMTTAYRLLCNTMDKEGMNYPLHLGVTEAGEGSDGRIRSSVGIGALLNDGIGDTIRVSLTEEPEKEIPVAECLIDYYRGRVVSFDDSFVDFSKYNLYKTNRIKDDVTFVVFDLSYHDDCIEKILQEYPQDYLYVGNKTVEFNDDRILIENDPRFYYATLESLKTDIISPEKIIVVEASSPQYHRAASLYINQLLLPNKVILKKSYYIDDYEKLQIYSSADFGGLLIDGFGDGIWISSSVLNDAISLPLAILQSSGRRISTVEYISCPGCGRTLYDIQSVVKEVKERTKNLREIKIAIMGCIVNGPGEMADADYGYIGASKGLVSLYKSSVMVAQNIPQHEAIDKLVDLIKQNGDWK